MIYEELCNGQIVKNLTISETYLIIWQFFLIRLLARATEDIFFGRKKKMGIRALKAPKKLFI